MGTDDQKTTCEKCGAVLARRDVKLPRWLETFARAARDDQDWPRKEYPEVAARARAIAEDVPGDGQLALLQILIDEIERLRKRKKGK